MEVGEIKDDLSVIKWYEGRVPACGIFCGGCPTYTRVRKPCLGAEVNRARCERCESYHLCCQQKGITYCFQCPSFPCLRLKRFSKRWEKHGQSILDNQNRLKMQGVKSFLRFYNSLMKG